MTHLKDVYVNDNQIEHLPASLWSLLHMEKLVLFNNKLKHISSEIKTLRRLNELKIGADQLENLPGELWLLIGMQKLNVSHNKLKCISTEIKKIASFKRTLSELQPDWRPTLRTVGSL